MCIITSTVNEVAKTRIYVSADEANRRQLTVYSNYVSSSRENAMILPVPNPESIELLNFSNYPAFFEDLANCFQKRIPRGISNTLGFGLVTETLPIYKVGSYQASIVPNLDEFDRLDFHTFKVDPNLYSFLDVHYRKGNFGFIVCSLMAGDHTYHPFAYTHGMHKSGRLFIPTMHYHPGHTHETGDWDHLIYSPSTTLHDDKYRFVSNRQINWNKLPEEYRWAYDTPMNCWEKVGTWDNHDLLVDHTVDPREISDDCTIM